MNLFETNISKEAKQEVAKVLDSGFVSAGKKAEEFEKELASFGLSNPVTVNSGTTSLFLALKVARVGNDDEVIIPAQTFVATGLAVLYTGAKPIFADINYEDGNISVKSIEEKITSKTKAIMPVHWGGYPCDMDEINSLASRNNLFVIEDAAHAFGSIYKGNKIGSISDFTCFSFQAIKILTTGDGGCVCSLSPQHAEMVKLKRWLCIDRDKKRSILGEREFDLTDVGYKSHMNDIAAAMGIGNLKTIDKILDHHRRIATIYQSELRNRFATMGGPAAEPGMQLMKYMPDRLSTYWLFPVLVNRRVDFIKKLESYGIPTSVVHQGIDRYTIFGGKDESLHYQRIFDARQLNLPINLKISEEDAYEICKIIKGGW